MILKAVEVILVFAYFVSVMFVVSSIRRSAETIELKCCLR